jgi:hypothetical protein
MRETPENLEGKVVAPTGREQTYRIQVGDFIAR